MLTKPVFGGELLVVGGKDNNVYFYSLASKRLITEIDVGADVISKPVISDTMVVVSTPRAIHGISVASATLAWTLSLKERPTSPIFLDSGRAHVGTYSGRLITFSPQTGQLLHERSLGNVPVVSGLEVNDRLYVCLTNGKFFVLDSTSSKTHWSYETELPIQAAPVVRKGKLYINNVTGRFLVFEIIQ